MSPSTRQSVAVLGSVWAVCVVAGGSARASEGITLTGPPALSATSVRRAWDVPVENVADLRLDPEGDLLVLGSLGVAKYTPNGESVWPAPLPRCRHLAVGANGNIYTTGPLGTACYDRNRSRQWLQTGVTGRRLQLDAIGNAYVLVSLNPTDPYQDRGYLTCKLSPTGTVLWSTLGDELSVAGVALALAVAPDGGVAVTGWSVPSGEARATVPDAKAEIPLGAWEQLNQVELVTVRYDASGKRLWIARYDSPRPGPDLGLGLVFDKEGNVYVSGQVCTGEPLALIKYTAAGARSWMTTSKVYYSGVAVSEPKPPHVLAWDDQENLVVFATQPFGCCVDPPVLGYSFVALGKYDRNGHVLWSLGEWFGVTESAQRLAVDRSGNVYACLQQLRKYGAFNEELWSYPIFAHSVVLGAADSLYVASAGRVTKLVQDVVPGAPRIVTPPLPQTARHRRPVTLRVEASGEAPLSFAWHFGLQPVLGGTNATLTFMDFQPSMSGPYWVQVSNRLGSVKTASVKVDHAVEFADVKLHPDQRLEFTLLAPPEVAFLDIQGSTDLEQWATIAAWTNSWYTGASSNTIGVREPRQFLRGVERR